MHSVLSSKSFRTSLLAAVAFAAFSTTPRATSAAEEVIAPEYIRCRSHVPTPSVVETWSQAIASGSSFGSMYSVSGPTYGTVCESKPEYAIELTELPAGATFYKAWGGSTYPVPPTASSVCATMTYDVEMWGLNAAGTWVQLHQISGNGEYVYLSATTGQCAMAATFWPTQAHALDGYSSVIIAAHAQQLSGNLLPITLGMTYPAH
jgi:hypothetical protein